MTRNEYNKWKRSVEERLLAFIERNGLTYARNTVYGNDTEYILSDMPNIGRVRIFLESYDTARNPDSKKVKVVSVYCRFMDSLDSRDIERLSYMENYNRHSGKYNWHTICDTSMYINVWFDTLLDDLAKIMRNGN